MAKSLKTVVEDTAKEHGWHCEFQSQRVKTYNDGKWGKEKTEKLVEFSQVSPAGEDFSFEVIYDNLREIPRLVFEYFESFDVDEHVQMWLEAKANGMSGIPSALALATDASEIEDMIETLALALREEFGERCF